MAPSATLALLSPAELSYIHTSLSLHPPIRPDGRSDTQFRPLVAETDILPGTNGSARVCFADGTEAIVGIKAEVEKSVSKGQAVGNAKEPSEDAKMAEKEKQHLGQEGGGDKSWVDMTIEIPGYRDDDALPVYLAAMLTEALVSTSDLTDKLWINSRFHWRLFVDVLLLSPPLSYPIPLLSLTTHLALISTQLPALVSEGAEDPLFNDDWDAALSLYPRESGMYPPVTLLVVSVGDNLIFDPAREELAVADAVLAISLAPANPRTPGTKAKRHDLRLTAVRTIDSPSRLTTPGVPDSANSVMGGGALGNNLMTTKGEVEEGVWRPPRGGMRRDLVSRVVAVCLAPGGVGEEVLAGLETFRSDYGG